MPVSYAIQANGDSEIGLFSAYTCICLHLASKDFLLTQLSRWYLYVDEQNKGITHGYNLEIREGIDYLSACPLLAARDMYHFPVTDGAEMTLTIKSLEGGHQARSIAHSIGVEEDSPFS